MPHPNQDPERLRRRRIAAGLSMTALAALADVTRSHVSQVEAGIAGFSPANVARIAEVLGCEITDLMPEPATNQEGAA